MRAAEVVSVGERAPLLVHVLGPTEEGAELAEYLREQLRNYPGAKLIRTARPLRWRGRWIRATFQLEAPGDA